MLGCGGRKEEVGRGMRGGVGAEECVLGCGEDVGKDEGSEEM